MVIVNIFLYWMKRHSHYLIWKIAFQYLSKYCRNELIWFFISFKTVSAVKSVKIIKEEKTRWYVHKISTITCSQGWNLSTIMSEYPRLVDTSSWLGYNEVCIYLCHLVHICRRVSFVHLVRRRPDYKYLILFEQYYQIAR